MKKLYNNPAALGNYETSKDIVGELVSTILDNNLTIKSLMGLAEHDYYTHTHSLNVSIYALSLGAYLKLDKDMLEKLGESALLHDLGKREIDADIINKNGKLTDKEFEIMKDHSMFGFKLAIKMGVRSKVVLEGIKYHHERVDGTGYPDGLKDKDIPLFAKIVAITDVFDALTSKRSYKDAMQTFEALKLMKLKMNDHLDVKLINDMIMMFR